MFLDGSAGSDAFWEAEASAWRSGCVGQGLVIRRAASDELLLSCGSINGKAVLALPLRSFTLAAQRYAAICLPDVDGVSNTDLLNYVKCVKITSLEDWRAVDAKFRGCSYMKAVFAAATLAGGPPADAIPRGHAGICLQLGGCYSIEYAITLRAWAGVTKTHLVALLEENGVKLNASTPLFEVVQRAVAKWCPDANETKVCEILANREVEQLAPEDFFDDVSFAAAVDDADWKEI